MRILVTWGSKRSGTGLVQRWEMMSSLPWPAPERPKQPLAGAPRPEASSWGMIGPQVDPGGACVSVMSVQPGCLTGPLPSSGCSLQSCLAVRERLRPRPGASPPGR